MFKPIRKAISIIILVAFITTSVKSPAYAQPAQGGMMPRLPAPGVMVHLSPEFAPSQLTGMSIYPDNALQFDFLINKGDQNLEGDQKKEEYKKLVKYFLASLTIPDEDQWVNLSPYEKDRIIKDDFGKTEMGRDLLAQDYLLKQITSSLIYPEEGLGKEFWNRIYQRAWNEYHTTNIPVNTFNKVWIVPDEAMVYESGNTAYILKSHLKVMLEEDYLALNRHSEGARSATEESRGVLRSFANAQDDKAHAIGSQIIRAIILPQLEKEVNQGRNFANLRQMYSGMVLATWYKKELKESLLGKVYADKVKVKGVDQDPQTNEAIYQQYLKAFKKGVFNYIKEDVDKYTNETIPRKYFSGGFTRDRAMIDPISRTVRTYYSATVAKNGKSLSFWILLPPEVVRGQIDAAMKSESLGSMIAAGIGFSVLAGFSFSTDNPKLGYFTAFMAIACFIYNTIMYKTQKMNDFSLWIKKNVKVDPDADGKGSTITLRNSSLVEGENLDGKRWVQLMEYFVRRIKRSNLQKDIKEIERGGVKLVIQTNKSVAEAKKMISDMAMTGQKDKAITEAVDELIRISKVNGLSDDDRSELVYSAIEGFQLGELDQISQLFEKEPRGQWDYFIKAILHETPWWLMLDMKDKPMATNSNRAVKAQKLTASPLGGIDFNSANLNMQIKRDGKGVPLPLAQQDMAQLNNIQGFVPVILEIKPAINLPILSDLQQKLQTTSAVASVS